MKDGVYKVICISKFSYPNDPTEPDHERVNPLGLWELKGDFFINVKNPFIRIGKGVKGSLLQPFKSIEEYKTLEEFKEEEEELKLHFEYIGIKRGEFFDRIFKPIYIVNERDLLGGIRSDKYILPIPFDDGTCRDSIDQLAILIDYLQGILKVIYPSKDNFNAFGFEIRNQIMLVCTEIETQFRGILKANSIKPINKDRYNIKDYVRLNELLKLHEYEILFESYPSLGNFKPFVDWNESDPRITLDWYNRYHSIKHDRVSNYNQGNLKCLLDSIAGLFVILLAQYGDDNTYIKKGLKGYFRVNKYPKWKNKEKYFPPEEESSWSQANFSFD